MSVARDEGNAGHKADTAIAWGLRIEPRNRHVAGVEIAEIVERTMSNAVTRGIAVVPGRKSTSRAKDMQQKLEGPASEKIPFGARACVGTGGARADDEPAREVEHGENSWAVPLRHSTRREYCGNDPIRRSR